MDERSFEQQKDQAVTDLKERGYAVLHNLVSQTRLEQARQEAEDLLEPTPIVMPGTNGGVRSRMCKGLFTKSRAFDDLYVLPLASAVLTEILAVKGSKYSEEMWGGSYQLSGTMIKDVVPGEHPRAFHRDASIYPLPIDLPTFSVNTLLALDEFTEKTGATQIVPFSHKWDKPVDQNPDFIIAEMSAGSMLMMDGSLWHTNGTNSTSSTNRKALNMYFTSRWLRPFSGINLGLPNSEVEKLEPDLQAVLR